MFRTRLQEILVHPAFISFVLFAVLMLLIPPVFMKYRIRFVSGEYVVSSEYFIFYDLDSDGESEKISIDLQDSKQTKIIIYKDNGVFEQYNIRNQTPGFSGIYARDTDYDKFSELFLFTINDDSIFLNIIDPLRKKIILTGRFIDFRRKLSSSVDMPQVEVLGLFGSGKNETGDLIFTISTGFSGQPRNVYRYNIENDFLKKSPLSGATINSGLLRDLDEDEVPEIILSTSATGNLDKDFPYSDSYTWLMVLGYDLEFIFPPVIRGKYPSNQQTIPLKISDKTFLVVFDDYFGSDSIISSLSLYDASGLSIRNIQVSDNEHLYSRIFENPASGETFFFLKNRSAMVEELDKDFSTVRTFRIPPVGDTKPLAYIDADGDGRDEYVFLGQGNGSIIITRDNFSDPVEYRVRNGSDFPYIFLVEKGSRPPLISAGYDDYIAYITYEKNPLYYLKYPLYILLYLTLFMFFTIVYRLQKYRAGIKLNTERKIAELQIKAINNQIDPHFMMNVLNAIGGLYATENNREKADYLFGKYARLIRQIVISSDRIVVTIAEEIGFIRDYLEIERFRFSDSFNYEIDISNEMDMQVKIPRMLIHNFVENAVKYGVRRRGSGGLIKIILNQKNEKKRILIEDDGPGLGSRIPSSESTGKGLRIVDEMADLFYRLEKKHINWTLENITGPDNVILGTRAIIEID